MLPLLLTVPVILSIYPKMEYKNVDFPEPTLPIILKNVPARIRNLGTVKTTSTLVPSDDKY
jgi:hypothetical protein